jgi:hypothetical protein
VLQDNGGSPLTVSASGQTFTFAAALATGNTFAVTILDQPRSRAAISIRHFTRAQARIPQSVLPDARLHVVERCGHQLMFECPDAWSRGSPAIIRTLVSVWPGHDKAPCPVWDWRSLRSPTYVSRFLQGIS